MSTTRSTLPAAQRLGDRVDERGVALGCDAQHRRDRGRHRRRVADRRQLDQPHAVGELADHLGTDLEGEPRLAHAADAGQRDERARSHELGDLADDRLPADQRGQLLWEVPREVVDAAEHREVDRESVGDDLVHRHAAVPPAQPVLTQRPQRARGRAAAPRSRRRPAPDRRAPTTAAAAARLTSRPT